MAQRSTLPIEISIRFLKTLEVFDERAWAHRDLGPVAQLGERLVCIQEVVGSIPVGSTIARWEHELGPIAQSG